MSKLTDALKDVTSILYTDEKNHLEQQIKSLQNRLNTITKYSRAESEAEFMPLKINDDTNQLVVKRPYLSGPSYKAFTHEQVKHAAQLVAQVLKENINYEYETHYYDFGYLYGL